MKTFLMLCFSALGHAASTKGPSLYMPEVVSPMGRETDHLYMVILWIVIVIFVITEGMLVYSLFAFRDRPGHKARFFHGSTFIEVLLALFPSLILLYLTVASGSMWNDLKIKRTNDKGAVHIQVLAEQFSWNFRYPGADGVFGTADDVISVGEMALPADKTVVMHISAKDVIHSFFIPEARVKQDAVPGLLTKMWFRVDHMPVWDRATGKRVLLDTEAYNASEVALTGYEFKSEPKKGKGAFFQAADSKMIGLMDYSYARSENTPIWVVKNGAFSTVSAEPQYIRHHFEIGCAQLCGTLHYAMRGTVLALTGAEFDRWLAEQQADPTLQAKWAEIWDKYHPEFNRIL